MKRLYYLCMLVVAVCTIGCKSNDPINRGNSISVEPNTYEISVNGGEFLVYVKSISAWSATSNQDWVKINPDFGQGDAYVTITIAKGEPSTANLLFSNGSGTTTLTIGRGESVTNQDLYTPQADNGLLPGKFSISAIKKIGFSQGNLQYIASSNKWRFAPYQWNVIEKENSNISSSYNGWIDLFGWGTGNNPTKTSTHPDDYYYFTDWGENEISNGGNKSNLWRTLSNDEWNYLLNLRTNANNLRGCAIVNDVSGLILLPDNATIPNGVSFVANSRRDKDNEYTTNQWEIMERAGAIFLPNAGCRYGNEIKYPTSCNYWSSTPHVVNGAINGNVAAYYLSSDYEIHYDLRTYGYSVRLVKDLE